MKLFKTFIFSFFSILSLNLFSQGQIINGTPANIEDFPYQAIIIQSDGDLQCGASILNSEWLLTAAHCFDTLHGPFQVIVGSDELNSATTYDIDQWIIPNWPSSPREDIALIHLTSSICFNDKVQPISYSSMGFSFPLGTVGTATGFGGGASTNPTFSFTEIEYISNSEADIIIQDSLPCQFTTDITELSFFGINTGIGSGDSGGPITIDHNNQKIQVGIASRNCFQFGVDEHISIFTDISQFSSYITSNIGLVYPESTVQLSSNEAYLNCGSQSVDLNTLFTGTLPSGASLIWSTDNNSRDGISPIINPVVSQEGLYYAFYSYDNNSCFSAASEVEVIRGGVETVITDQRFSIDQENFNGTIRITNGGEFIVQSGHNIFLNQESSIIVENGGRLIVEPNAEISPCINSNSWKSIVVEDGGFFNSRGEYINIREGISASGNSTLRFFGGKIQGTLGLTGFGVRTDGPVDLRVIILEIENFNTALSVNNGESYYNINRLTTNNVNYGISLFRSPSFVFNSNLNTLTNSNNQSISVNFSGGTLLKDNTVNSDIRISNSPSVITEQNDIGNATSKASLELYFSNNNVIRNNTIEGNSRGVESYFSNIECHHNQININSGSSIYDAGILLMVNSGSNVNNNVINTSASANGIASIFSRENQLSYNRVTGISAGIRIYGSAGERLNDNIINASSGNGIDVFNSPDAVFNCNEIYSSDRSIEIRENSTGQDFFHNYLSGSVDLEIRSVTGPQDQRGNEFIGETAISSLDIDQNLLSSFRVDFNSDLFVPDNITSNGQWFFPAPNSDVFNCVSGVPGSGFWNVNDPNALCDQYSYLKTNFEVGSVQMNLFILNAIRRIGWTIEDFEDNCGNVPPPVGTDNNCFDLIYEAEDHVFTDQISDPSFAALLNAVNQLASISMPSDNDLQQMEGPSLAANTQFATLLSLYEDELDSQLYALLSANCQDVNLDVVRETIIECIEYINTSTHGGNYNSLSPYANLCAIKYGRNVHLARALLADETTVNFESNDNCSLNQQELIISNGGLIIEEKIYPNPTLGHFTIEYVDRIPEKIEIYNSLGVRVVSYSNINSEIFEIDLGENKGLFFLKSSFVNGEESISRVMAIK